MKEMIINDVWVLPAMALAVDYAGVVMAVGADFVSGVCKARRAEVKRTSRGYRRTFDKLGRYFAALVGLTIADAVMLAALWCLRGTAGMSVPLLPVMSSLGALGMVLCEAKSICERVEQKGDVRRGAELVDELVKFFNSRGR